MRYLPYFLIVSVLILLVFAGLLWLKPASDPRLAIVAAEREVSEEVLKREGMKPELLEELKDEGVDARILKILLEELDAGLPDAKAELEASKPEKDRIVRGLKSRILDPRILKLLLDHAETGDSDTDEGWDVYYDLLSGKERKLIRQWREARFRYKNIKKNIKDLLTDKKEAKWRYGFHYKDDLDRALDYRGLNPDAIDELSMEELEAIHAAYQRKARRYRAKFSRDSINDELAESSIFTYEGDGKVRVSIPHEEMTPKQREHLKLIKAHIKFARKGHFETRIIVQSDEEAVLITYYDKLPKWTLGAAVLGGFIIEHKTGKLVGGFPEDPN